MNIFIVKSSEIQKCPKKSLAAGHYLPGGGCKCLAEDSAGLSLRQKERKAVTEHECPVCSQRAGDPCCHLSALGVRRIPLKRPHVERVQLVDPELSGYRKRAYRTPTEVNRALPKNSFRKKKGWSDTEG